MARISRIGHYVQTLKEQDILAKVNTVLGPLDTSELGFTLAHEHILNSSARIQQVYSERHGKAEIYVMSASGFGQTTLTDNPANDLDPSWGP